MAASKTSSSGCDMRIIAHLLQRENNRPLGSQCNALRFRHYTDDNMVQTTFEYGPFGWKRHYFTLGCSMANVIDFIKTVNPEYLPPTITLIKK